jgi:SAM-dependent methyltransferase
MTSRDFGPESSTMSFERGARERASFNEGLQRSGYSNVLAHSNYFYRQRGRRITAEALRCGHGRVMLEIGASGWSELADHGILPRELHCINISEVDLERGRALSRGNKNRPCFCNMDAHYLAFPKNYFDVVFGFSVLHHLDFARALDEICRVLKLGGRIYFYEPLGINPVAKAVRWLTPKARTVDERPLGFAELRQLDVRFQCTFYYAQLFSVPFGLLSRALFTSPDNAMMAMISRLDMTLDRLAPPLRPLFRHVNIVGTYLGK